MDEAEAWRVLGLRPGSDGTAIRRAYRSLVRRHHPDLAGPAGTERTARLTQAYEVLTRPRPRPALAPAPPPGAPVTAAPAGADTIAVHAPADETFFALLEAAHTVGSVTHVAPDDGLLEVLVTFDDGRVCSCVLSLQGRGDGTTDVFCTLQALDGRAAPPVGLVVGALAGALSGAPPGGPAAAG